jgi:valyl-tRNA synthetase
MPPESTRARAATTNQAAPAVVKAPFIDTEALPKHFESAGAEQRWDEQWQASGIYHYDGTRPRQETFVVDTPPPTVSGSLHMGHVFSYTQADVVVRFWRMRGKNIFYPMGWDDNGLPTERRVQNFYHVRCEPHVAYEPGLTLPEATDAQRKERPRLVSRKNFIELCHELTEKDELIFQNLFRRLALSVDWRQTYATIDDHCRWMAQVSFLDLSEKGLAYQTWAPTMWDVDFQTAVAQAEVEDRVRPGAYHHIEFGVKGSDRSFVIATTRPELLPACVGVTAHPDDARYKDLFGKEAVTPLFHAPVPIFPSELADPTKGTGILMVCTFGDQTDVIWWRERKLALRQIIGLDGKLVPVTYGSEGYPSLNPELANQSYAELSGKKLGPARDQVVQLLRDPKGSATGRGAPLQKEPEKIEHPVKFYERGERPLEFLSTRQWFVRLLDRKPELLAKGAELTWRPEYMGLRYRDWTEGLGQDWCVSRQRYFGVSIPVWYRVDAAGKPDYEKPLWPAIEQLPIDPMSDTPRGFDESQRDAPGGFTGETDIFDTWFTSSLTPQIGSHWRKDAARHARLFPADVRPQGHDIIRTWAFYTIAKALCHEGSVPWHNAMISGWILDPDRKKMSKSKGNVVTPMHLLEEYGVDSVRYWAASARLGADTAFDPQVFKIGKKLVTKLFNAGKFVLGREGEIHPITCEIDRAFIAKLGALVESATADLEAYRYANALQNVEAFFWSQFTDTYIELAKPRAWGTIGEAHERGSGFHALRLSLNVLLRLFAPVLPYITEEVWSWVFAKETGHASIHVAPWPSAAEFAGIAPPDDAGSFDLAMACFNAINKAKSDAGVSVGRVAERLSVRANEKTLRALAPVLRDVAGAARCSSYQTALDAGLEDGVFAITDAVFAEKA